MKKTGLWVLLLLGAGNLLAQYTVSGTVTDARTGEPVMFANVLVQNTTKGALTDIDGKYSISIENNQEVNLIFSSIGYLTSWMQRGHNAAKRHA